LNRFLRKFTKYIFIVLVTVTISFVAIFRYYQKHPFKYAYTTVFLGDSRIEYLYKNGKNLGCNSEGLKHTYYKILALNKSKKLKTIYLGLSHHSFSGYFNEYLTNEMEVLPRYFVITPKPMQMLNEYRFLNLHFLFKKQFKLAWKSMTSTNNFIEGHFSYPFKSQVSIKKSQKRIKQQFYQKNGDLQPFSMEQIQYLNVIKYYCRDNNIRLIIINTPVYESYFENIPQNYKQVYEQNTRDLEVIDMSHFLSNKTDFLPDGDHISFTAFKKCTSYLDSVVLHNK
jgi:hypothetical protein